MQGFLGNGHELLPLLSALSIPLQPPPSAGLPWGAHSTRWDAVRRSPVFAQASLPVFSDSSGSHVPVATSLSVLGFCHKLFDMFS